MMFFVKEKKALCIITSLLTILPIFVGFLLWERLPEEMAVHFSATGVADGFASKTFAVVGLNLFLLAIQWLCIFGAGFDKRNKEQSSKVIGLVFWIVPVLSWVVNGISYGYALGYPVDVTFIMPILLGLMFLVLGNFLPKMAQSRTIGIKISWTLKSKENWFKTHRFGGRVWMLCGVVTLLTLFLPEAWRFPPTLCCILVAVFAPMLYSYLYSKKEK